MQTSYSMRHTASVAGMLVDMQTPVMSEALKVETAAGIGMGLVVSYGTDPKGCTLGGSNIAGITCRSSKPGAAADNATTLDQYEVADVVVTGKVWCPVSGTVAITDAVAYNSTTGVVTAGPAEAGEVDLINAKFRSAATDGNLAIVMVSMPQTAPA